MTSKCAELVVLSLVVLCAGCSAMKVDLAELLRSRQRQSALAGNQHKRMHLDGNPCNEPEKPFPCKSTPQCIPMAYVCDDNFDCEDGYDEDSEVCTAAHRPPVEDIMAFLESEKDWIMPNFFGGKSILKVAHGLAVSQTVDDFKRRLGLPGKSVRALKKAMEGVRDGHEEDLEALGMPKDAWQEVSYIFSKLIKSGFA